jgi:Ser/Thr protein kinase RdoA (MazF antagonist)
MLMPFPDLIERMFTFIRGSTLFAPGLLDRYVEGFEWTRAAYGWDASRLTASHNDPNPRNLLFDGRRLWLIDWETAFQNDPLVDVAIVCDNLATTPMTQAALLESAVGSATVADELRLQLIQLMTRLYYACLLFSGAARIPRVEPHASLAAPTPAEFQLQLADGRLQVGDPHTLFVLGTMMLARFDAGLEMLS